MGEHKDKVLRQALKLDAEEWAKGIKQIYIHREGSMYYETKESAKDFDNGSVTDTSYYDGRIERTQDGKVIRTFGEKLVGDKLIDEYQRYAANGPAMRMLHGTNL